MSDVSIDRHALISDCHSAALVTADGSVDWLCLPRFDSAPLFARLLDDDAGHFRISLASPQCSISWRYRPSSLVLETTWSGDRGELVVTDTLALGRHERGHELGSSSPGVLLRTAQCTRGAVDVAVEYAPRPEFGLVHPRLTAGNGVVVADGGATTLVLSTNVDMQIDAARATATVGLYEGQQVAFALEQASAWAPRPKRWTARRIRRRIDDTGAAWQSWSTLHQRYEGPLRDLVHHSGVVLQGLTYAPSGAVVAAPTTSLPEGVGSGRTWDYRFTWVRDASMTMQGLYVAACPDEAERFFAFIAQAAATQLHRGLHLQIVFGIGGERDLAERELSHLTGWKDSGPVRVGNGAWSQHQLDVYGALLDAAHTLREQLHTMDEQTRSFLVAAVDAAAAHWTDDDQGIWEMRGPARPFTHSKLMCWVALDRGLALCDLLRTDDTRRDAWVQARADVRAAILDRGWSSAAGAYAQALGSDALDASVLLMAIVGFLPPTDDRLLATIDAIEQGLRDERGLIYRYDGDDGFEEPEGTFLLCTFWLAQALAMTGQTRRSRQTLERAAGYASSLGLFAEQVDPASGELLGNFPQAFSHLGLVNAAQALAEAERSDHGGHAEPGDPPDGARRR